LYHFSKEDFKAELMKIYFEVTMKSIFFINVLYSLNGLPKIFKSNIFWQENLFFEKFGQISFTELHNEVKSFFCFFGFVHSSNEWAFGKF